MARSGIDLITVGKLQGNIDGFYTGDTTQQRHLETIINAMGAAFERYMGRYLHQTSRTVDFDITSREHKEFFPLGVPITSVTGYYDSGRDFTDAIDSDDCIIGPDAMSVLLVNGYQVEPCRMALRLVYTGGMATSTSDITAVLEATPTGTFAAGDALLDGSDVAIGTCVSYDATSLEIVWTPTPTTTTYDEETGGQSVGGTIQTSGGVKSGTIESFDTSNLLYDYPDVMMAALIQCEYIFKRKDHAGAIRIDTLGETQSYVTKARALCEETRNLLDPHRIRTF